MSGTQKRSLIILILGALTTVSPFSIDMYLAAFPQIAEDLRTTPARVALSVSSYFVGLAIGQIMYGPLLDRFGRKKPLAFGLLLYIAATIGCMQSKSVDELIVFRFLQALGGSAAGVASVAMVRDFFHIQESAKIFSLLMLILGVSPLLAPTVGSFVTLQFGWHAVFLLLAVIAALTLAAAMIGLPESHQPDPTVSLKPLPILKNFAEIFREPLFLTYALSGSFCFAGLLVYVTGSPIIFMDLFHVTPAQYGAIFASLSVAFIGGSQLNLLASKRFTVDQILQNSLIVQSLVSVIFLAGACFHLLNLTATLILLFLYLLCVGMGSPNTTALALSPFGKNIGSASALIGSLQIGIAALVSSGVGLFAPDSMLPSVALLALCAWISLALATFLPGRELARKLEAVEMQMDLH